MTIFSRIIGDIEVGIGDLWGVLSRIGVTPQVAQTAVVDIVNVAIEEAEAPLLHQLVAGYQQPALVTDLIAAATKIPNLPSEVVALLQDVPKLAQEAAADPTTGLPAFMATVTDIETKLGIAAAS